MSAKQQKSDAYIGQSAAGIFSSFWQPANAIQWKSNHATTKSLIYNLHLCTYIAPYMQAALLINAHSYVL